MRVTVLNGVNLGMLGAREPEVYGTLTHAELTQRIQAWAGERGQRAEVRQTDCEGEYVRAIHAACGEADAVIVNGGLGPTVDDLSQEIAAQAAGVELVLNEEWLVKMEDFFTRRARTLYR